MAHTAADRRSSVGGSSAQLTIATKFHVPATEGAAARPRLAARLSSGDGGRLTLVAASPGAGKSTVLAQWAGGDKVHAFAWLTLDPADSDPVRPWTHVLAALERAGLPVDDRLLASARGPDRIHGFLPWVVNALAEADRPIVLVLDRFIRDGLRVVMAVGLIVAAGAFFTGPSATAVRTREAFMKGLGWIRASGENAGPRTGPGGRWTYAHLKGLRVSAVALAAVIFVFWSQPSGLVALAIALILLVVLGLIELIGRPPAAPAAGHHAGA